jgi:hypothetical protein
MNRKFNKRGDREGCLLFSYAEMDGAKPPFPSHQALLDAVGIPQPLN